MKKKHIKKLAQIVAREMPPITNINGSRITGVHYDAKAVDTITAIADGLRANAESLGKLADVLRASNVTIEAMVKVDQTSRTSS